jgi:phosphohistidine swiveling domain-containing protein
MNKFVERFKEDLKGHNLQEEKPTLSLLLSINFARGLMKSFGFISKYYDFDFKSYICFIQKGYGDYFFSNDLYQKATETTFDHFRKVRNEKNLPELKDYNNVCLDINAFYKKYTAEKLAGMKENDLLLALKKVADMTPIIVACTSYSELLSEGMIKTALKETDEDEKDFGTFLNKASLMGFDSYAIRFDELILDYAKKGNADSVQWLLCDYTIAPPVSQVPRLLNEIISQKEGIEEIKKQLKELNKKRRRNEELAANYKSKLSGKALKLFEFIQLSIRIRDQRKEFFQKSMTLISNIARELFKRQNLNESDVVYTVVEELLSKEFKKPSYRNTLEDRKSGILIYVDSDGWEVKCGDTSRVNKELSDWAHKSHEKETNCLKGNPASAGFVKAKVSVIFGKQDFEKFVPGTVLVTSMTRPEFLPLIKKAAAIITDEGGITCHAAILSRELEIPCVVNTKVATKILKNGDTVEVDANNGIIKRLEA